MRILFLILFLFSCNSTKEDIPQKKELVIESCPEITFDKPHHTQDYKSCCQENSADACYLVGMRLDKTYLGQLGNQEFLPFYRRACLLDQTVKNCSKARTKSLEAKDNLEWLERVCKARIVKGRPEAGHNHLIQRVTCASYGHYSGDKKLYLEHFNYLKGLYDESSGEVKGLMADVMVSLYLVVEDYDNALKLLKKGLSNARDPKGALKRWGGNPDPSQKKFMASPQYQELENFIERPGK